MKKLLVTGAAGFIGSHFVLKAIDLGYNVSVIDSLTYAGNINNLKPFLEQNKLSFFREDIVNKDKINQIINLIKPNAIINFAAESHVDRSIENPEVFVKTNIVGTFTLLEVTREYYKNLSIDDKSKFRFLQISTDEVFGQLGSEGQFNESSPFRPNSPYSSSKAAADHLVKAWHSTYQLPTIITHSSNNYGPRQWPEKLIPLTIANALNGKSIEIYGNGQNIRDWLYVEDHCSGIFLALEKGRIGESYCFGGSCEMTNLNVVQTICNLLDQLFPMETKASYQNLIKFVKDRPGHDFRYSIDDSKSVKELNYQKGKTDFEKGLRVTVDWNLANLRYFSNENIESKNSKKSNLGNNLK